MSEFATANGFPEDPVTSDTVHALSASRYLIPLPVLWIVWIVVLVLLDAVAPGVSGTWGASLLGGVTMLGVLLGVLLLVVRYHVVFWSPDRLVLVASRIHGRIIRVVSDAFCSQCRARILPSLLGVRFLLETPDGSWRLKTARRGRSRVQGLVATLGTPSEAPGEEH